MELYLEILKHIQLKNYVLWLARLFKPSFPHLETTQGKTFIRRNILTF